MSRTKGALGKNNVSAAHKAQVRQAYLQNKRYSSNMAAAAKMRHSLGPDGEELMEVCGYCGATQVLKHAHKTGMCVDCGKLYQRWQKARRLCIDSELRLLKPELLQRRANAVKVDKLASTKSENFYKTVIETEVPEMEEVTSKVCKQCGRELGISRFKKYAARGTGKYNTKQGYYTICKDCESISNRLATLQRKVSLSEQDSNLLEALREHYQKLMDNGLQPATAPARRLMGVDMPQRTLSNDSFMNLLSSVQGISTPDVDEHCRLVRERGYASYDEAAQRHKELEAQLRSDERYEEITELLDEWWDEEE